MKSFAEPVSGARGKIQQAELSLTDFVQKPDTLLSLVKNLLQKIGGGCIAGVLTNLNRCPLSFGHLPIVVQKAVNHTVPGYKFVIVILNRLQFADMRHTADGCPAD